MVPLAFVSVKLTPVPPERVFVNVNAPSRPESVLLRTSL
jgi:hypothetical protein